MGLCTAPRKNFLAVQPCRRSSGNGAAVKTVGDYRKGGALGSGRFVRGATGPVRAGSMGNETESFCGYGFASATTIGAGGAEWIQELSLIHI